jgi:hypothetical protein
MTMQTRVRKFAHILERIGLAMAGAASGLFVGAHTGSAIPAFTSQAFVMMMMVGGAVGFYLGIDTPQLTFHPANGGKNGSTARIDATELLSAIGTFCAALTAFASVGVIVLREEPHIVWTVLILIGWVLGISMQIVAGAIARMRD